MKKLRLSVAITAVLCFFSVLALILMFLALSDISHLEEDLTLEWYITGICIMIISAFTISTFVTLGLLLRSKWIWLADTRENPLVA